MAEYWESEFIESLKAAGKDNMELSGDSSRDQALENIAKPIIEAIKKGGSTIKVVGSATCNQINVMYGMQAGDIWSIKDNGIIVNEDGSSFNACSGDLVLYDGEKWNSFLHLDLSGYVTEDYFNDVIAAINAAIIGHAENKLNPHDVTAEQVGAYTKAEVDSTVNVIDSKVDNHVADVSNPHSVTAGQVGSYTKEETDSHIASAVSGVGTFIGALSTAEINALTEIRIGDYVDVTDSGYINGGGTSVVRGDCVVYDGIKWTKRLNDGKGLFVVDGQLRFG